MTQPVWAYRFNLGDVDPVEHGGYFVFEDISGDYPPEAIILKSSGEKWTAWRFVLEPCTYIDGILSDNPYHPAHPAWFAKPESERADRPQDTTYLANVAGSGVWPGDSLARAFCSDSLQERANAWRAVGEYHGWVNLDGFQLEFDNRAKLEAWLGKRGIDV